MRDVIRVRQEVDIALEYPEVEWKDVRNRYSLSANYWPQTQYKKGITK
jgi:hypothetical protein